MIYKEIIVDADLCLKLGSSQTYKYLEILLPLIADTIYIHKVVNDEIMTGREQLDALIKSGKVKILSENDLSTVELTLYKATYSVLGNIMLNKHKPNKNRGEVCTLSMAKAKGIHYFATDEMDLQSIIDHLLNTGMDNITCIRIKDIIALIKAEKLPGLVRKDAKRIWIISDKNKEIFDKDIWPLQST